MMYHDTIAVSEYWRFLKNLDDLSQSLLPKLHTNAVHFECELTHHLNKIFMQTSHPSCSEMVFVCEISFKMQSTK